MELAREGGGVMYSAADMHRFLGAVVIAVSHERARWMCLHAKHGAPFCSLGKCCFWGYICCACCVDFVLKGSAPD